MSTKVKIIECVPATYGVMYNLLIVDGPDKGQLVPTSLAYYPMTFLALDAAKTWASINQFEIVE